MSLLFILLFDLKRYRLIKYIVIYFNFKESNKMSAKATASPYKKDYIPGYNGHVPSKMERFGNTSG